MRKRTDQLYVRTLGPRELEALDLIERQPGISTAELAAALGVTTNPVWQIARRRVVACRLRRRLSSRRASA